MLDIRDLQERKGNFTYLQLINYLANYLQTRSKYLFLAIIIALLSQFETAINKKESLENSLYELNLMSQGIGFEPAI